MNLIYVKNNSLSKEICAELIYLFEQDGKRYHGLTASGLNKNIKDTTDCVINEAGPQWDRINKLLIKELNNNVNEYVNNLKNKINETKIFKNFLSTETLQMQKYDKNKGKYIYHNDYSCQWKNKKMRQITFLWYINDVEEGGETEFWGDYKIKPEAGKLILFPASWTYPHCGKMPISDDKYIITGWLWEHYD